MCICDKWRRDWYMVFRPTCKNLWIRRCFFFSIFWWFVYIHGYHFSGQESVWSRIFDLGNMLLIKLCGVVELGGLCINLLLLFVIWLHFLHNYCMLFVLRCDYRLYYARVWCLSQVCYMVSITNSLGFVLSVIFLIRQFLSWCMKFAFKSCGICSAREVANREPPSVLH